MVCGIFRRTFVSELLKKIIKNVILTMCWGYGIFLVKFAITIR